jgi:Berberine and berberine like
LIEHARRVPSPLTAIAIADCHGAYSRVSPSATAYFHRDQQFDVVILSSWTDRADSQRNIDWTSDCHAAIEPHLSGGIYVNDLGEEEATRVVRAYGGNLDRLIGLKRRYDPDNFLRLNQNIPTEAIGVGR